MGVEGHSLATALSACIPASKVRHPADTLLLHGLDRAVHPLFPVFSIRGLNLFLPACLPMTICLAQHDHLIW